MAVSQERLIEETAKWLYFCIYIEPQGFPNGSPSWDELPVTGYVPGLSPYFTDRAFWRERAKETIEVINKLNCSDMT